MSISVSKIDQGYAVRLPFELKDNFRSVFKTATWSSELKAWLIGVRSKARLEQWIDAVQPVLEDMVEAEQAELNHNELMALEHDVSTLRFELARARRNKRELQTSLDLLNKSKAQLVMLKQAMRDEQAQIAIAQQEARQVMEQVCDMDAVLLSYDAMLKSHGARTSAAKERFNEAAAVIHAQHQKLIQAGYRCAGMEALADMNPNRPDRDVPHSISLTDLFLVSKMDD